MASTSSCRVAAVILEEPTKPFMALDGPLALRVSGHGHENAISLALVGALRMIMRYVFRERVPQGAFTKQDQLCQRFLFDGSHPALRVSVQIRRPRWQWHARHSCSVDDVLKGWTEFTIAVMDQILPGLQKAPVCHGDVARDLDHPALVGVWSHAGHVHLPAREVDKKTARNTSPSRPSSRPRQ